MLILPRSRPFLIRWVALAGAVLTFAAALGLLAGFDTGRPGLQWRTRLPWIPPVNAAYDVGVNGFSLALILLTAWLLVTVMVYVLRNDNRPKGHAALFLLMATGLLGVFAAQDLLLFYLFFEVGLVPMYFIIGIWGHDNRRYAAMKFFLYTRAASLAMLLSFLALYLLMEPHTFSLPAIIEAQPLAQAGGAGGWVMLGMLIGFGVKLPTVPLHNWLPDAHVEAPTEGSVMLAGIQLKMGAYGLLAIMLPIMPQVVFDYAWLLLALALVSLVYGSLAALAQQDLKRLIAYTSINHMGYIMLAGALAVLAPTAGTQELALNGGIYQIISHGLLTGGMFFAVGMIQDQTGTREMGRLSGLSRQASAFSLLTGVLVFGSLGLPGLSGFIGEFQVLGAAVSWNLWIAGVALVALVITTGLYLRIVISVLWGEPRTGTGAMKEPEGRKLAVMGSLVMLSLWLGLLSAGLLGVIKRPSGVWRQDETLGAHPRAYPGGGMLAIGTPCRLGAG
ncbi:complex I subunit 4 family protein [Nitrosococcus oceani]|uniref:complex I subunit 4 family protein n=1 Tax=Nitrosococcus oceani TaxID=1229 RepID=UPI000AB83470|nr:NADH-quinone oxidoreductase subunit M [Nitrosococcus oceani]